MKTKFEDFINENKKIAGHLYKINEHVVIFPEKSDDKNDKKTAELIEGFISKIYKGEFKNINIS